MDRKVLADMAVHDQKGFEQIAEIAKKHADRKIGVLPRERTAGNGKHECVSSFLL